MPRKSSKVHKPLKRALKKLEKSSLLRNKFVLYLTLLLSIVVALVYISKNNWDALCALVIVGVLTNYFTKNMTITLGISIIVSLFIFNRHHKVLFREGMEVDKLAEPKKEEEEEEEEKIEEGQENMGKGDLKYCFVKDAETDKYVRKNDNKVSESKCKAVPQSCWASSAVECKKTGFSNKDIPSSKPKRIDGQSDDDESEGDRIDYSKTLEMAYDNLQDVLGEDGIKGITGETSKLIKEQKNLMNSMKTIGPMMNQATEMMATLKKMNMGGLGDITKMVKGKK